MTSPLVETKLFRPRLRGQQVKRQRLTQLLEDHREARLTVVSAPAGFGKTTLLAAWLGTAPAARRQVAWLSLEEGDGEPLRFWTYLATAVQRAAPEHQVNGLAQLASGQASIDNFLITFVNDLSRLETELTLVLDDYHLVDSPQLQRGMLFLLEHLPDQVHLVISTRIDPALPHARLRARGELLEVRASDLRFSRDEVSAYLNRELGLDLSDADLGALESRTEGWIAALQLAALSLQGRDDPGAFIAAFAGDDRFIVDYLIEEVLDRQPADVRDFLLQTSVLDRLSGPLCDAVTDRSGGKRMLESLDRANLFLVALDDTRGWYRYHHLFADLLRARLHDEHPELVNELHRRATHWYDAANEPLPAIRHALAAGDTERAADLVELAIPDLRRNRQEATISGWVDVIPDRLVQTRPVLAVGLISGLMAAGRFDGIEERIDAVEQQLRRLSEGGPSPVPPEGTVVVDLSEWARLPGELAMYRAAASLIRGDSETTVELADEAMARAAEDDHLTNAGAAAIAGLARWGRGELEAAHGDYTTCVAGLLRAGHIADVLGCSLALADIRITQGRLTDATRTYEAALTLAEREPGTVLRGTADMYVGLSQVAWQRNDLAGAARYLELSDKLGDGAGLPQHPYRSRVARACLRHAQGDLSGATDLLAEAERVYFTDFLPDVRPVSAMRIRFQLAQGDLATAHAWAHSRGLSVDDELSYVREYEHIVLARVLLASPAARHRGTALEDANQLLDRLLTAAETGGRIGNVIEILLLQAQARRLGGDEAVCRETLRRALLLAEPEGHLRVFLDEGPGLTALLLVLDDEEPDQVHVRRVLNAVDTTDDRRRTSDWRTSPAAALVEPLSERELDVLRLLDTDLDGPAIARELSVSLATVRTHTQHIYTKLGVNSRREAVREAARLELLRRPTNT